MAAVYARFKGPQGWEYQKIGRGRPPKGAKFHIRFTDAQGKRRWSQPFNTPQEAHENASGVTVATQAAAQGLTVAEYQDQTNAGRTSIKIAVEKFLTLHRNDRPKTVKQYNGALTHLLANLPQRVRFVKDLATSEALDTYLQTLQTEDYANKTISTRMGVVFSMLKDNQRETGVEYPSTLVSLPDITEESVETYSDEEIIQLFSGTVKENRKEVPVMTSEEKERYLFFLHTGCREQEVMYATWDDVDFEKSRTALDSADHRTFRIAQGTQNEAKASLDIRKQGRSARGTFSAEVQSVGEAGGIKLWTLQDDDHGREISSAEAHRGHMRHSARLREALSSSLT